MPPVGLGRGRLLLVVLHQAGHETEQRCHHGENAGRGLCIVTGLGQKDDRSTNVPSRGAGFGAS